MNGNFLNKFTELLEKKLMPVANKISKQKHLMSVRDGIVASIPLTIIGGISLIIASPPVDPEKTQATNIFNSFLLGWYKFAEKYSQELLTPFNMTMGIMALFIAIAIAYSLAKRYEMHALSSGITSGVVFLMVTSAMESGVLVRDFGNGKNPLESAMDLIPADFLGGRGLITAIIVGLLSVEITRFLVKKGITIKMPAGVPAAIADSFASLIPIIANIIVFYGINLILKAAWGLNIPSAIFKIIAPALDATDSAWMIAIMMVIGQVGWFFGIHDTATVSPIMDPLYKINLLSNAANRVTGKPMEHILTSPFWAAFIAIGGSGATIALLFWLLRSKSAHLKAVGKAGLIPGLFNINEPIIFGMPIFLNPTMFIPFVLIQPLNGVIAYFALKLGMVGKTFIEPPWTTPAIIGGPLSTMDWKAAVLVVFLIVLDAIIYYPFFKVYEKSLLEEENQANK